MRRIHVLVALALGALVATDAAAYCLTGVRWPASAGVYYNPAGKITSGQCISASQMDSAVTGGITPWRALTYAGTTGAAPNKRDGRNVVGWAKLGGGTLGITNYLSNDRTRTVACKGNLFANLYEADVRITTSYRWTAGGGGCPCAAGSAFYVDGVSEHEFGHVVGLCHVNQPSSLMYPSFGVCENKNKGSDETAGESALCY
ncbi:MAG TPA: matrixin family metalloprotease [Candidatus Polarisedimenticolaceae bacterium]